MQDRAPGEPMTVERIDMIVGIVDPASVREGNLLSFRFVTEEDIEVAGQIISDKNADRMRIVIGITEQDTLLPCRRIMAPLCDNNMSPATSSVHSRSCGVNRIRT